MSIHTVGRTMVRTAVDTLGEIPNRQAQRLRPGKRIQTHKQEDVPIMYAHRSPR